MKKELYQGIHNNIVKSYCCYCGYTTEIYTGNKHTNELLVHCERCNRYFAREIVAKPDHSYGRTGRPTVIYEGNEI